MGKRSMNGTEWAAMVAAGAERLSRNVDRVNALNVFPVPDGDTGTNMNLTMTAGLAELRLRPSADAGKAADTLSKGLLMGARGNSGVILSQLFRGCARALAGQAEVTPANFAGALQQGVDTAYKSVVKPVEGTILTVAREAARQGQTSARRTADLSEWMADVLAKAQETLARTQDMLPVLKQVGVVDSGGQGLVCLYEGFAAYLAEDAGNLAQPHGGPAYGLAVQAPDRPPVAAAVNRISASSSASAQSKLATESIVFPYDMEFFIRRPVSAGVFPEAAFRQQLERDGDSIILIDDGGIVKVHVHSRRPGDVLNAALTFGEITGIHILNMREQHRELLAGFGAEADAPRTQAASESVGLEETFPTEAAAGLPYEGYALPGVAASPETEPTPDVYELAAYGVVAVSVGDGNAELFRSLGVDIVISGGQSMNPSTEDLLDAVNALSAQHIFLLPNNPNIRLAAKQAAELAGKPVTVVPTCTLPQGMAAMLAFQEQDSPEANAAKMARSAERVVTGQITRAVRDTAMDGVTIREGQYIGIRDKTIVTAADGLADASRLLLEDLFASGGEVLTVLTGEGADKSTTDGLTAWIEQTYPDVELEVHEGGQPLYPYLFAVET